MFPMWQAYVFMEHQAMNNSQNTINSVNCQKNHPTEILRFQNQLPYQEKQYESDTHRTYITGKTLRLPAEIKEAEYTTEQSTV